MKLDRLNKSQIRSKEAASSITQLTEEAVKQAAGGFLAHPCSGGHLSYAHQIN